MLRILRIAAAVVSLTVLLPHAHTVHSQDCAVGGAGDCASEGGSCDDGQGTCVPAPVDACGGGCTCATPCLPGDGESACDDDDPCTQDACDVAGGGLCVNVQISCDDGHACTNDRCTVVDGAAVCERSFSGSPCDDGNAETILDACTAGVCAGVPPGDCALDLGGDEVPELTLADADLDGACEFPSRKTVLRGTLRVRSGTRIEFRSNTILEADQIIVEEGGALLGEPATLRSLSLVALTGPVVNRGEVDLRASDDLTVKSLFGDVDLGAATILEAGDRLLVDSRRGTLTVAPLIAPAPSFTLFGASRVDLAANGANGSIRLARARIGSRRMTISTRANVASPGAKELRLDGVTLTTDPADTDLASGSDLSLESTGPVVVTGGSRLDAGGTLRIQTARDGQDACLSEGVELDARNGAGFITVTGVRGRVLDDGTTTFSGRVKGTVEIGLCGTGPGPVVTATSTPAAAVPTPTATPNPGATATPVSNLTLGQWEFYVRIAETDGSEASVLVPKRSSDPDVAASIATDHVSAFALGDQVTGAEIAALGGDTLARLIDAAHAYLTSHPQDYAGFAGIVELRWAKRTG